MTTLKDYMRDFQQDTVKIVTKYITENFIEEGPNKMTVKDYNERLEDSLDMQIDIIIAKLIGGEV